MLVSPRSPPQEAVIPQGSDPQVGTAADRAALDELFSQLYPELSELAHRQRERWRGDYTLNTTMLIHEAYLKLADQKRIQVEDRARFLALAARAMRHILINYARDQRALKRGGDLERVSVGSITLASGQAVISPAQVDELVALNDALHALEAVDARQSQVVECRFFGGMTVDETAAALGVSPRTVKRDWVVARAWLYRRIARE